MISKNLCAITLIGIVSAATSTSNNLRGGLSIPEPSTPSRNLGFLSSKVVSRGLRDGSNIQSLRPFAGGNIVSQSNDLMKQLIATLGSVGMDLGNIVQMDIAVNEIGEWSAVEGILKDYWVKRSLNGGRLPAMSILQLTNTSHCEDVVKVQITNVITSRHPTLAKIPNQLSMDSVSGVAYVAGVISSSNSNGSTYAQDMVDILPIIKSKLREVGMDEHNIVKVSVAMEVQNPIRPTQFQDDLIEFNEVYNSLMSGAVLPTMVVYGVNAFPGSEKDGLQIQVSVVASRILVPVAGDLAHQIDAPLPHSDFILPFSGCLASESQLWLSGAGYYGNSSDIRVAVAEALDSLMLQLEDAAERNFDSAAVVVSVDVLVSPRIRPQIGIVAEVYNTYFSGHDTPPALSLREVAEIGLESPVEVTISAARKTGVSYTGASHLNLPSYCGN